MDWNEEEHLIFYASLNDLDARQRSKVTLDRARDMLQQSTKADELKAIESVLTYWKLNLKHQDDKERADTLFYHLYQRMGEPEKANTFSQRRH